MVSVAEAALRMVWPVYPFPIARGLVVGVAGIKGQWTRAVRDVALQMWGQFVNGVQGGVLPCVVEKDSVELCMTRRCDIWARGPQRTILLLALVMWDRDCD